MKHEEQSEMNPQTASQQGPDPGSPDPSSKEST